MYELSNFDAIQIGIASPEKIREWSYGEVTKPETINYRTQKPERDGLFCERIFGPTRDWECHCGRYKRIRYKGVICEKCGVEVTKSKVRRERMGHIELATPVSHIWYFRGVPSRISLLLDISPKDLEQVLYFVAFIVLDPGKVPELSKKQVITDKEYRDLLERYKPEDFRVGMGAEAIKELLMEIDLERDSEELKEIVANSTSQKRLRAIKRLEIVEAFRISGNRPEWMILDVLPVLPPELRPMVQLDGGRFATSDLNDLYRRVINRNNRLKKLKELGAPDIIVRNEKRMLQEAVDALIDNGRRGKAVSGPGNRDLKSLSGLLRGKQGRFRQNLLGKRVDYSGRSVIVVGPELKLYQCGLPKEMALELFKPFIMKKLVEQNLCHNIKTAKRFVDTGKNQVWDILEEIIKDHPVLLNRAPTLHRLGIQAFEPVLVEGRAIKLHPLACGAFNADFDGDQMAVHVPLSIESQVEARILMLCTNNILKLSDGKPIVSPTQDMVIGSYYLTIIRPGDKGEGKYFSSFDEAVMAYQDGDVTLQSLVWIRTSYKDEDGTEHTRMLHTTVGRCIFNSNLPQDLQFVNRRDPRNAGLLELDGILGINACMDEKQFAALADTLKGKEVTAEARDKVRAILRNADLADAKIDAIAAAFEKAADVDVTGEETHEKTLLRKAILKILGEKAMAIGKKQLSLIVDNCFKYHGATETAAVLDKIKALGYKYSTIGAITASVFDMHIPAVKKEIIAEAEEKIKRVEKNFARGILTDEERYQTVVKTWKEASDLVEKALVDGAEDFNPIWMMANSGARGNMGQIRQLSGMRGLMADPSGRTIELPVRASFREGLSVLEYFISSHGGRKGLADTALKTADSGYLTRRLVDVSHGVIVRESDCGDSKGTEITAIRDGKSEIECLADRIAGRFTINPIVHPVTGEVIVEADSMITDDQAKEIEDGKRTARQARRSGGHHRGAVHRRTRHPAHDENVPLRRRRDGRRHHPGSAARRGALRGEKTERSGSHHRELRCGGGQRRQPRDHRHGCGRRREELCHPLRRQAQGGHRRHRGSGRSAHRGLHLSAGYAPRQGRQGRAGLPHQGSAVRLPSLRRRDQRQAHRGHRASDAAQGQGGESGRHRDAPRLICGHLHLRGREREGSRERRRARQCEAYAARHHQGGAFHRVLPLRRVLPGDRARPHRGSHQEQDRSAHRAQRECHHRQAHPRRHGHEDL